MVRFEEKKLVIEIETFDSAYEWCTAIHGLIRILAITDKELLNGEHDSLYCVCNLLDAMIPDEMQIKKLI